MTDKKENNKIDNISKEPNKSTDNSKEKEIGGYKGQEPTTYNDWQHKGRVSDF